MLRQFSSQKTACFRRWTRKSYAVFNSLGKQIKIGVLALSLSLVTMSAELVSAQDNNAQPTAREGESDAIPIDEVLINATAATLNTTEPARVVSIIQRQEIVQLPVQNLSQLLEYIAGVDLRQRGANDVQADINIRGGNFDQSLILLNGINLTDPQTGHYNLDLPVDLESIDRIEILQGPGSRVLGPHAFAGIINIITGSSTKSNAQARAEAGSHSYQRIGANGTLALNKWTLFSSVAYKKSDGYVPNTDFDMANLFAQARYSDSTFGQWNLQLGAQQKKYGANGFYSLTYPNQYEATRTYLATLDYSKSAGIFSFYASSYYRRHFDKYELFRSNPPAWYKGHNYHLTDVYGVQLRAHLFSFLGKTTMGAELRGEHIYSNVLGESVSRPKHVKNESDSTFYTKEKLRNTISWFAEQVYHHRKFSISGGVQGSYSNSFGHYLCANADATYSLTNTLQAHASVGSSLRLPTFTDLYYQGPTNIGNPNLLPEQGVTYEAGLKYIQSDVKLQSSVFYRQGKNIIDWVRTDSTELWQSRNHINLNTLGTTLSGAYAPHNTLARFVSSARLDYAFLQMYIDSKEMQVSRTLDYLRHKVTFTCIHPLPFHFGFSWSVIHERRNGQYVDFSTNQPTSFTPVTLVDTKLLWNLKYLLVYIDVSNIFNHTYFDFANLQQPGRWTKIGIQATIGHK